MLKKIAPLFAVLFVFALFIIIGGRTFATSELEAAKQRYIESVRGSCITIANRTLDCYEGDKSECEKLKDSQNWFMSEFGKSPDFVCQDPGAYFLVFGA